MPSNKRQKVAHEPNTIPSRHKIIVGVDYGTTYSGVCYVTTDKKGIEDINIITTWPGEISTSSKVPTRIAYVKENNTLKKNKWGFEVESRHISYCWTKLLLDKNAAPTNFDDPSLSKTTGNGIMQLPKFRDAPGVCEDFLREVYVYISERLKRQIGVATFDLTPIECWITLPAIWSEEAKDATLKAARNAGFGSRDEDEVYTIAEPEAAAIATLRGYSTVGSFNAVKAGEHVLICDCGGGTVDITTYTISEVEPEFSFDELCVGIGGKCGSTYIDRNFHALLTERFGAAFENVPFSQKGPGSMFMTCFEKLKRSFGVDEDAGTLEVYPLTMKVEDSEYYEEDERAVRLTHADMKGLFDPVIKDILELVDQQVKVARREKAADINRIILVGGFGDSVYLNKELRKWCSNGRKIELLCPPNSQAAVVRGAALRGLNGLAPKTKQARRHYGYGIAMPFRPGKDLEKNSFLSKIDGVKYCSGRMHWMVHKGTPVFKDTHRARTFRTVCTPKTAITVTTELWSSGADNPPERADSGAEKVGTIVSTLPPNFHYGNAMKKVYNKKSRKTVHYLEVEVRVVFGNKGDNLKVELAVNGRVAGTSRIEFTS